MATLLPSLLSAKAKRTMENQEIPNWLRVIVLILSLASFLPQIRLLLQRGNTAGISLYYLLFNLISATEQFALSFYFIVNRVEPADVFTHEPPTVGDWLNLAQTTAVFFAWLVIFSLSLWYPSGTEHPSPKIAVSAIYFSFFLISLAPVFIDAVMTAAAPGKEDPYHKWEGAFFHGFHAIFIFPIVTILVIAAFFVQARKISDEDRGWPSSPSSSLSVLGLAIQAVVFSLVALTWLWRLVFPWHLVDGGAPLTPSFWKSWYELVGWVPGNNAFFAIVQAVLFWVAWRRGRTGESATSSGETEPLLRG